MAPIITLTTDFGLRDPWVGSIKGTVLSINREATVVDISHGVSPHNVMEGAFVLGQAYATFPKGTIHVAVVDPGVGGERRGVAVETERYIFVGPDNGIFTFALEDEEVRTVVALTRADFFLPTVSDTFHGRDVFAPVAAHISLGKELRRFGGEIQGGLVTLELPKVETDKSLVKGEVVYVDNFGNLVTNIRGCEVAAFADAGIEVDIGWVKIDGISKSYSSVKAGEVVAIVGSLGLIEVACAMESAAARLAVGVGEPVMVRKRAL